jgi:tRNA(fMet)-specific endonuclease VapC
MIYLLDSDTIILLMRGLKIRAPRTESQRERAQQARSILSNCRSHAQNGHQLTCSAITISELEFGARNSDDYAHEMRHTRIVLGGVFPLDYTASKCAEAYGRIRHQLESTGKRIGENDLLIAAHALALNATLVTNNTREFNRVHGLCVENWSVTV